MSETLQITLNKGRIATSPSQRANLVGLGLLRREMVVVRPDTRSTRGMIKKVIHLVDVRRPVKAREDSLKPLSMKDAVEVTPPKEAVAPKSKTSKKAAAKKETAALKASGKAKATPTKGTKKGKAS
jgi:large subunit ribosomal protein L30